MWYLGLIVSFLVSVVVGWILVPVTKKRKLLLVHDQHKKGRPLVSTLGGIILLAGFTAGILLHIAVGNTLVLMLAALCSVLVVALIGLLDDIIDVPAAFRVIIPVFAAAPLAAVKAGVTIMYIPLLGKIDFGIFYQLLAIPIGVTGAANAVNMVAGLNGLEAGMGSLISLAFLAISLKIGTEIGAVLSAILLGSCLGFLLFNWAPAKILPGNSGSYLIGCAIAVIAILGNMERAGIIIIIPYLIELLLKSRTFFAAESFGKLRKDGTLEAPRIDSLTHLVMRVRRFTESQVVLILMLIEALFSLLAYLTAG